jgi:hypothetical protein
LGETPDDQEKHVGSPRDVVQRGAGVGVEDPAAVTTAEIQDRWTAKLSPL